IDARVKAADGNLTRAFEDVSALLGTDRDISSITFFANSEQMAWRALEDALRLAPAGKEALPPLAVPELVSQVRRVRQEQAMLGLLFPTIASQPSLFLDDPKRIKDPLE